MPPALLIIADDLTGANDTGVQFAKHGSAVIVSLHHEQNLGAWAREAQVLVVNTESRHVSAEEAFQRVYRVAQKGVQLGIPQFYKKTDSTLRGNIGSELAALIEATGERELFFAPAYPKLHRTTRHGLQFVNGVPLSQTTFAADPLNPICEDSIAKIIAQQVQYGEHARPALRLSTPSIRIGSRPLFIPPPINANAIYVVDAETDEDLRAAARLLKDKPLLAGSAGFAEFLPAAMQLPIIWATTPVVRPTLSLPRLVVNGSLHEASFQQVAYAAQHGWAVRELTAELSAAQVVAALAIEQRVILTTSTQLVREPCAPALAQLASQILDQIQVPVLAVFGGDTLAAIAKARGWQAFRPQTEFLPGAPLVKVCGEDDLLLLTKAGGFGSVDLLPSILN